MVRETFGPAVDEALALLEVAGVPREAVATIRARLRADRLVVAVALAVVEGRASVADLARAIADAGAARRLTRRGRVRA